MICNDFKLLRMKCIDYLTKFYNDEEVYQKFVHVNLMKILFKVECSVVSLFGFTATFREEN